MSSPHALPNPASVTNTPARRPTIVPSWLAWTIIVLFIGLLAFAGLNQSPVRETARRSVDSSNLRQIGQASVIYASDSQDRLPQVNDIHAFAFELARIGGLNDATIWLSSTRSDSSEYQKLSTVLTRDRTGTEPAFSAIRPSFAAAVRGLHLKLPDTTPIAWTRGLQPDGTWSKDSPYGGEGGHIVFLGGNVTFFRKAELVDRDGKPTTDIRAALPPDAVVANN